MPLTDKQREKIVAEARTWLGTPYRGWSRLKGKGGGTDCGQLLAGVLINTGFLPDDLSIPAYYSLHVAQHKETTAYLDKIEEYMREIPESEAKAGDFVVYKFAFAFAHAGIIVSWPTHIIHAMGRHGVTGSHGKDEPRFRKRTRKFYTLKEEYCNGNLR